MKIAPKSVNKEICKANENVSSSESDLSSFEDKIMEDNSQIEDDEQEEEDECDNEEECSMSDDEIAVLRTKISSFSLKKLAELKSKIGLELFNKIMYGKSISSFNEDNSNKIQSKKSGGTHRPRVESSTRPPPKFRSIRGLEIRKAKNAHFDPRFAASSGDFDQIAFHRDYSFIEDLRKKDIQELQNAYKQIKREGGNPKQIERIKRNLLRLRNQQKDYQDQKLKEDILSDLRRTNIERMNNGERPIYLNNNELKGKFIERKKQQKHNNDQRIQKTSKPNKNINEEEIEEKEKN
uniref:rRNA biogenesis protein RRP36 n=2 Tax=Meloidogyne TaxID=189290 RepID=A0A915PA28_9BILA